MGDNRKTLALRTGALFAALALYGSAMAQNKADTPINPFINDPSAVAAGKAVFDGTCGACHGEGAIGGRGPALNTDTFTHGDADDDLFQVIRGGVAGTQMPPFTALPADDIWRVVTYIKSLSGRGPATMAGDPVAGERVFFGAGACSSCHEINGRGADFAVDLSAEGTKAAAAIHDGILHRNPARGRAPARRADIVMKDGRKLSGIVRNEDSFTLHLERPDGTYLMLDKSNVRQISATAPAMPDTAQLSAKDIDDLVAYLSRQKARDFSQTISANPKPVLPYARLLNADAEPQNWPMYWGDYKARHFSELKQINSANVAHLQARWSASLPGSSVLESTPLVVDGIMYLAGPPGDVYAFDAATGLVIWQFHRKQDVTDPYQIDPSNKGVAVLDGRVFYGTLDDNLIALDAHTGRELWEKRLDDTMGGVTITGAPLAIKDKIIVGMSGGDMGARGWLDAYDPATGNRLWRFDTVPGPGVAGNDTWPGETWKMGGAATWLTGTYDPEQNLIIWGTGNPGPDYNPDMRKGDNLYTDCVIALDPDTGKLVWYYQTTPNDGHDWDAEQDWVLEDRLVDGKPRKLLLHADRNGMFYEIDRTNGKFLWAKPFVRQTWNMGFEPNGRPLVNPKSVPTLQGQTVFPAVGGTNFQAPSYDAQSGLYYLTYGDAQGFAIEAPETYERGKRFNGRGTGTPPPGPPPEQGIEAIDSHTGAVRWKFPLTRSSLSAGVLATRGGVVFAATAEGQFIALNAKTGKPLWHFKTANAITASPISYAAGGRQFVAVTAGNMVYTFALPN